MPNYHRLIIKEAVVGGRCHHFRLRHNGSQIVDGSPCLSGAESPFPPFICNLAIGRPLEEEGIYLQTQSKAFEMPKRAIRLRCGLAAWKMSLMICVILRSVAFGSLPLRCKAIILAVMYHSTKSRAVLSVRLSSMHLAS